MNKIEAKFSKILVTGGAGLIGSAVIRNLLERNKKVVAYDNFSIGVWHKKDPNVVWVKQDIVSASLQEQLGDYSVDAVIHCAAHPGGRSLEEPVENVRVNCLGSMRIFEWCARLNIPVIYLSSSIVYGEQPNKPIAENATLFPGTIYGVCKVACENFLKVLENGYGLKWTVLRLFATYGAGHTPNLHQGIVNVILTQLMSGNKLIIKGPLSRVRDIIYIEDSARTIVDILFCENARGKIINVGTGIGTSVENIIKILCKELDRKKEDLDIQQAEPVVGDPHYNVADITQLINLVEFRPEYDLRAGLKKLVFSRINEVSH